MSQRRHLLERRIAGPAQKIDRDLKRLARAALRFHTVSGGNRAASATAART